MPLRSVPGWNHGKTVSRFRGAVAGIPGGSSGSSAIPSTKVAVTVAVADWTADASGYVGAPNATIGPGGNGEAQKASVRHNLQSSAATIVSFIDTAGRIWPHSLLVDQKQSTSDPSNVIEMWLAEKPAAAIVVLVEAFS